MKKIKEETYVMSTISIVAAKAKAKIKILQLLQSDSTQGEGLYK